MSGGYDDYDDDRNELDRGPDDHLDRDEGLLDDALTRRAKEKTNVPGILLIVVGVLNILGGAYCLLNGVIVFTPIGRQAFQQQMKGDPEREKQIEQMGWTMDTVANIGGGFYVGLGLVNILGSVLMILAGIKMRALRAYTLSVFAAVLSAIPCVSVSSCPCVLGLVAGIWALVVLLNADVKAAFR
jgi:hypothetical protein